MDIFGGTSLLAAQAQTQVQTSVWSWTPTTLGTLLTGLSVFVSSVLLALSMRQLGRSQQAGVADHKRRAMSETQKQLLKMNKDNSDGLLVIKNVLDSQPFMTGKQADKLLAAKWGDGSLWKTSQIIREVLVRMDSMALGVTMGLLDVEVVWRSQGRELLEIHDELRFYIAAVQRESHDQFRNFDALAEKLDSMHKREMVNGMDRGHGGLVGVEGSGPASQGASNAGRARGIARIPSRGAGQQVPRGAVSSRRAPAQANSGRGSIFATVLGKCKALMAPDVAAGMGAAGQLGSRTRLSSALAGDTGSSPLSAVMQTVTGVPTKIKAQVASLRGGSDSSPYARMGR